MSNSDLDESLLMGMATLTVTGPERLPRAAWVAGNMINKLQWLVSNIKQELNTQIGLEELHRAR